MVFGVHFMILVVKKMVRVVQSGDNIHGLLSCLKVMEFILIYIREWVPSGAQVNCKQSLLY